MSAVTAARPALRALCRALREAGFAVLDAAPGGKHLRVRLRAPDGHEFTLAVSMSPSIARRYIDAALDQARRNARHATLGRPRTR